MDIGSYMAEVGREARAASRLMARATTQARNTALAGAAAAIAAQRGAIAAANADDMERAAAQGLDAAALDRLQLTDARIDAMIEGSVRSRRCRTRSVRSPISHSGRAASRSGACACRSAWSASSTNRGPT